MTRSRLLPLAAVAALALLPARAAVPPAPDLVAYAAASGEGTWQAARTLSPSLGSRDLFTVALALCEANRDLDRLDRLLEVAGRMQDRDPESRTYGNFRWSWEDGAVLDTNAVDFGMQAGVALWLRHRDRLAEPVRQRLQELLRLGIEGSLRHVVPESYTNIALMNAANLILLGEAMDRPDALAEGRSRLDRFCFYTWENGIHEYGSPTYYGTDLDNLVLLRALTRTEPVRTQAQALLELFWTDLALNWFPAAAKLGGAHSRDYDYLHGLGYLDKHLWLAGWLPGDLQGGTSLVLNAIAPWSPPEALRARNADPAPRLVRQVWGIGRLHSRTHYLLPDVTLGSAGAGYGNMDLPLTVDFAGPRDQVRVTFIPDARRDPYGRKKIPSGGGHDKCIHLTPFWAAAQRTTDALGLVLYRPTDLPETPPTLESHIVLPLAVDALFVGDTRLALTAGKPQVVAVPPSQPVVLRRGTAAAAFRVLWSRSLEGTAAPAALVCDGNPYGAVRLTVSHHGLWGVGAAGDLPGAAFWVRIGGGLTSDTAFEQWRRGVADSAPQVASQDGTLRLQVPGTDGPVTLSVSTRTAECLAVDPPPSRAVLELDGRDVGKPLVEAVVPAALRQAVAAPTEAVLVDAVRPTIWEAEAGKVVPDMTVEEVDGAFGGRCVWAPGKPGERGGRALGSVTWRLRVPKAGTYYAWGRVLAPTPDDDSFLVRVATDTAEPVGLSDWHTGTHTEFEWTPVTLGKAGPAPIPLELPAGDVLLQLRVREDGVRIDRLFLTPDPAVQPQ